MTIKEAREIVAVGSGQKDLQDWLISKADYDRALGFLECAEKAGKLEEALKKVVQRIPSKFTPRLKRIYAREEIERYAHEALAAWREVQGE